MRQRRVEELDRTLERGVREGELARNLDEPEDQDGAHALEDEVRAELSPEDKLAVSRARKIQRFLSQPFDVAKVFTGSDGVQVPLEDTISSFKAVVAGEYDHLPEAAFYMVGGIDEVIAKAERLAAAAA